MGGIGDGEEVEGERKAAHLTSVGQVRGEPALPEVRKRGVLASFCVTLKSARII